MKLLEQNWAFLDTEIAFTCISWPRNSLVQQVKTKYYRKKYFQVFSRLYNLSLIYLRAK